MSHSSRFSSVFWSLSLVWRNDPRLFLGVIGCTIIRGAAPAAFAIALRGLVNSVAQASGGVADGSFGYLAWLALAFATTIADSLAGLAQELILARIQGNLTLKLNSDVMRHCALLDVSYVENAQNRELLNRVQKDPGQNVHAFFLHVQRAIVSAFQVVTLVAVLVWLEPLVLVLAPVFAIPFLAFQWRQSRLTFLTEYQRTGKRRWTQYFLSRLTQPGSVGEIKLLGIGGLLTDRFIATMREFRDQDRKLQMRQFVGGALFVVVTTSAFYALFARITARVTEGMLSIGDLAIFGGAVVRLRTALESAIRAASTAYEQTLYIKDLREFLSSRANLIDDGQHHVRSCRGAMNVSHVSFAYPGTSEKTLHDISFDLHPGEVLAIVGENGSGKSTLAKLLVRLYDVDEGTISLDGRSIVEYPLAELHQHVVMLSQNFGRYEASLAENIAYGNWERLASDRQALEEHARATGVDQLANRLPQGFDTELGREFAEHDLSGGQWQLVAFARTLARDASIVILDEPTSNIDARAENSLFKALRKVAPSASKIIISHRFSTVRMADRILVLQRGTIIEEGTHRDLLAAEGHYAYLYSLHNEYRENPGADA